MKKIIHKSIVFVDKWFEYLFVEYFIQIALKLEI